MKPTIYRDNNCFYLIQDLQGLDLYERTRAIKRFISSDIKILEECVNTEIKALFKAKGINVYSSDESVLKRAYSEYTSKYGELSIVDLFKDEIDHCEIVQQKDNLTIVIEDDRYLQCGIQLKER